jgi:hypothetical protein
VTVAIEVWALLVLMFTSVGFACASVYLGGWVIDLRDRLTEERDDAIFYKRRAEEQADAWSKERARSNQLAEQIEAAGKLINDQRQYHLDLRDVIDPEIKARCSCCRRCGPVIPCRKVIETWGESCEGACFCGLPDAENVS